jgi:hypothetical protein
MRGLKSAPASACAIAVDLPNFIEPRLKADRSEAQAADVAAPSPIVEAPAAPLGAAFFCADFFARVFGAAFLAEGFFLATTGAAVGRVAFFATATAFFAVGLAIFSAEAALAADFFFATGAWATSTGALIPLLSTRNASRFFAPVIHAGARPKVMSRGVV